jgi:hypothetical protein
MKCHFCDSFSVAYMELVMYGPGGPERDLEKDVIFEVCMDCFNVELKEYYTHKEDAEQSFCCFCKKFFGEEEHTSGYLDFWDFGVRSYDIKGYAYGEICIPCGPRIHSFSAL